MDWTDYLYAYDDIYEGDDCECSMCGREIVDYDHDDESDNYVCSECWQEYFNEREL